MSFGLHSWVRYMRDGYIFKAEPTAPKEDGSHPSRYITIEIGTKPKPYDYTHDNRTRKFMCCFVVVGEMSKEKKEQI